MSRRRTEPTRPPLTPTEVERRKKAWADAKREGSALAQLADPQRRTPAVAEQAGRAAAEKACAELNAMRDDYERGKRAARDALRATLPDLEVTCQADSEVLRFKGSASDRLALDSLEEVALKAGPGPILAERPSAPAAGPARRFRASLCIEVSDSWDRDAPDASRALLNAMQDALGQGVADEMFDAAENDGFAVAGLQLSVIEQGA